VKPLVVTVDVEGSAYDVVVGPDALLDLGGRVKEVSRAKKIALVSDQNVADLFGARVGASLVTAGFDVFPLSVAPGEASKSWQVAGELLQALAQLGLDRRDLVVALGGGVIGDLAGFAAAAYLRGVDFVQVPTTLLAQVDSSVGGKTGVDLPEGKNLVGAFKQPRLVVADT
jgi:3-dehydroquinate synthetase